MPGVTVRDVDVSGNPFKSKRLGIDLTRDRGHEGFPHHGRNSALIEKKIADSNFAAGAKVHRGVFGFLETTRQTPNSWSVLPLQKVNCEGFINRVPQAPSRN